MENGVFYCILVRDVGRAHTSDSISYAMALDVKCKIFHYKVVNYSNDFLQAAIRVIFLFISLNLRIQFDPTFVK